MAERERSPLCEWLATIPRLRIFLGLCRSAPNKGGGAVSGLTGGGPGRIKEAAVIILKILPIIHFLFGALALFLVLVLMDWFSSLVFIIPFATAVASGVLIKKGPVISLARVQLVMTLLAAFAVVGEGWLSLRDCPASVIWPWLVGVIALIGLVLPWIVFTVFHVMEIYSRRGRAEGGSWPGLPAHALMAVTIIAVCTGIAGGYTGPPEFFTIVMMGAVAFLVASITVFVAGRTAWFRGLPVERQRSSLWLLAANASVAVLLVPVLSRIFSR